MNKLQRELFSNFATLVDKNKVLSVCSKVYPSINGRCAEFFQERDTLGGWLVATDKDNKQSIWRVSQSVINQADAVKYDPYNDAGYAMALLKLADFERGLLSATEACQETADDMVGYNDKRGV